MSTSTTNMPAKTAGGVIGAALAALLGIIFFFVIIGVFGLTAAVTGLLLFIAVALGVINRWSDKEARP
jgi:hypothetical protein